jgi:hypothetical protein
VNLKIAGFLRTAPGLTVTSVPRAPAAAVVRAGACRAQRLAFAVQTKGKRVVTIKPTVSRLGPGSIRYGCSVSGGTMKITADGRIKGGLRKALAAKLAIRAVRNEKAPRRSAKLTFRFNW